MYHLNSILVIQLSHFPVVLRPQNEVPRMARMIALKTSSSLCAVVFPLSLLAFVTEAFFTSANYRCQHLCGLEANTEKYAGRLNVKLN
jgi:hypothetical protein